MIIKITPDKEKAKSILRLIKEREEFILTIDINKFPTNAAENYYEIIKELATTLILLDGLKAIGENAHRDLIDSLINYKEFSQEEIIFMNDLRTKRNNSFYEGKKVDVNYLKNNQDRILKVMGKLKRAIKKKL